MESKIINVDSQDGGWVLVDDTPAMALHNYKSMAEVDRDQQLMPKTNRDHVQVGMPTRTSWLSATTEVMFLYKLLPYLPYYSSLSTLANMLSG